MRIECVSGPVTEEVMGTSYRFDPAEDGRFIADVHNPRHIEVFLAVSEHYRNADATDELPAAPATLISLDPDTAELDTADFTLHCHGSGFTPGSVIYFADQPEPIVFVSAEEVTTIVKPSLGWGPATVTVRVDGSAPLDFVFTEPEAEAATSRRSGKAKGRRDD